MNPNQRTRTLTLMPALLGIVLGLGSVSDARADAADYSPHNVEWQGTSKLFRLAADQGFAMETRSTLHWKYLRKSEILFFLYPTAKIPREKLIAYLKAGGRVIIADDFGSTAELLEQLGVRRVAVNGARLSRLHAENPALPIATSAGSHPLNIGIPELVTNHPAAYSTSLPSIYRLEPNGGSLVVAATLGRGRIVLIADPSIFINRMLKFPGNEAFARRLLGYFGRAGEDTYLVYSQEFTEKGSPKPGISVTAPPPGGLSSILADANNLLTEFNEYMLDRVWIMPIATLLAGLLLALAVWVLPMMRPVYDASWTRPGEGPPPARYVRDLDPYLGKSARKMNFAYPAAVLRDVLDIDLEEALGIAAPLTTMDEPALKRLVARRAGSEAEQLCASVIQLTRRIPHREMVTPYTLTPRYSFRDLQRLQSTGQQLLQALRVNT
ncbi:MAG: DUF4350 domain-containing protein [bacterium]